MEKIKNIIELYCQAKNFFLCFTDEEAKEKENEVKKRGMRPVKIKTGDKITIFELNKII